MNLYKIFYVPLLNAVGFISLPFLYMFKNTRERLGLNYPKLRESLWIHASSVGEINGAKPLIKKIQKDSPNIQIVITTMTYTGKTVAEKISPKIVVRIIPLDFPFLIRSILKKINPDLLIIIETEIWPAMINESANHGTKIVFSNARLSDKSYPKYFKIKRFLKSIINSTDLVISQSVKDSKRFTEIGFKKVISAGNLKFAIDLPEINKNAVSSKFKVNDQHIVITFGSSRPGEEELIIKCFSELSKDYSSLRLIIVPRHLSRLAELSSMIKNYDIGLYSKDQLDKKILIIDEMGILTQLYSISDITLVGGSFFDFGGHNPLEPAFYSKAIIMGKYHNSCQASVNELKKNNGIIISEAVNLKDNLQELIVNEDLRKTLGLNAKRTLLENANALETNSNEIEKYIKNKNND